MSGPNAQRTTARLARTLRARAEAASRRRRAQRRQGFTLVELMVVIVIICLLATVVAINVLPSQDRAMVGKGRACIAVM